MVALTEIDFQSIDARIIQSVRDGDEARQKRDTAKSQRKYDYWERKMFEAQDAHTAAWADRKKMSEKWDQYFKENYGSENERTILQT